MAFRYDELSCGFAPDFCSTCSANSCHGACTCPPELPAKGLICDSCSGTGCPKCMCIPAPQQTFLSHARLTYPKCNCDECPKKCMKCCRYRQPCDSLPPDVAPEEIDEDRELCPPACISDKSYTEGETSVCGVEYSVDESVWEDDGDSMGMDLDMPYEADEVMCKSRSQEYEESCPPKQVVQIDVIREVPPYSSTDAKLAITKKSVQPKKCQQKRKPKRKTTAKGRKKRQAKLKTKSCKFCVGSAKNLKNGSLLTKPCKYCNECEDPCEKTETDVKVILETDIKSMKDDFYSTKGKAVKFRLDHGEGGSFKTEKCSDCEPGSGHDCCESCSKGGPCVDTTKDIGPGDYAYNTCDPERQICMARVTQKKGPCKPPPPPIPYEEKIMAGCCKSDCEKPILPDVLIDPCNPRPVCHCNRDCVKENCMIMHGKCLRCNPKSDEMKACKSCDPPKCRVKRKPKKKRARCDDSEECEDPCEALFGPCEPAQACLKECNTGECESACTIM